MYSFYCERGTYVMEEYTIKRLFDGELIIQYVDRDCDYKIIGMLIIFILHSL